MIGIYKPAANCEVSLYEIALGLQLKKNNLNLEKKIKKLELKYDILLFSHFYSFLQILFYKPVHLPHAYFFTLRTISLTV